MRVSDGVSIERFTQFLTELRIILAKKEWSRVNFSELSGVHNITRSVATVLTSMPALETRRVKGEGGRSVREYKRLPAFNELTALRLKEMCQAYAKEHRSLTDAEVEQSRLDDETYNVSTQKTLYEITEEAHKDREQKEFDDINPKRRYAAFRLVSPIDLASSVEQCYDQIRDMAKQEPGDFIVVEILETIRPIVSVELHKL